MINGLELEAPRAPTLTDYDRAHARIYIRLLDAEKAGASWRRAAEVVLGVSPDMPDEQALLAYESHLARARWMMDQGYRMLLRA